MAPRAFVAGLAQETNVFAPLPTGLGSFSGRFQAGGSQSDAPPPFPESLLDAGRRHALAGRVHLSEGPNVGAHPSGRVTRAAYETLRDQILHALDLADGPQIVAVHLHGAMIADGYDDCEGDLLTRIRDRVGPDAKIGAMIDPHAHLSPAMVRAAEVIVAYKEYPHTDFRERAEEVWNLLLAAHAGEIRPVSAVWDTGLIGVFHTSKPEVRALVDHMQDLEHRREALSASLVHSFPWGDAVDLGTRALVICDGDADRADWLARDLAERAREVALAQPAAQVSLEDALGRLAAAPTAGRPMVLADAPDNPGGGAAGDSTYVLAGLFAAGVTDVALGPLWDPQAVDIAFNAGPGARLALRVGGKSGPFSGSPLDLDVEVLALAEHATQAFAGEPFPLGRAASVRAGGIDIVLVTERDQARGPDLFTGLGIDLTAKRLIVVKSSQHFYAGFAPLADQVVYLDVPGSLQLDLTRYPYRHVARPRWPMDARPAAPWRVV